ncbi:hypothetical protein R1flu_000491 [Riccia fluitans]|uniref:Uncharacterized protein n=1 Tax=Riccia fluitans TaxID=41844 RepID=A0ABD1Y0L2_9MARC
MRIQSACMSVRRFVGGREKGWNFRNDRGRSVSSDAVCRNLLGTVESCRNWVFLQARRAVVREATGAQAKHERRLDEFKASMERTISANVLPENRRGNVARETGVASDSRRNSLAMAAHERELFPTSWMNWEACTVAKAESYEIRSADYIREAGPTPCLTLCLERLPPPGCWKWQIAYMERVTGDAITELRSIVTEKGTSVKGRFQKMQKWIEEKDWFADTEVVEYHVQACPLGFEKVDTDDLLEGLDEPGYSAEDCTEDSDDEEFEDESSASRSFYCGERRQLFHFLQLAQLSTSYGRYSHAIQFFGTLELIEGL